PRRRQAQGNADQERERPRSKAAGGAVSVCGATVRPEESKSRKAGALKQKAPNSDARESRAVTQVQRREDVNRTSRTKSKSLD
ncbi:MAG: hypothetical protein F6K24_23865, partial [Okeania sp. SIO2D1]|nr:hypothetical protein [Okeania sp. SIO2D1]